MIILPKAEQLAPKSQPHNFFIWGAPMSGKSYFASYFPNPLILNTDGNSEQGTAPAFQIRNLRDKNGRPKQLVTNQIDDIVLALQNENEQRKPEEQFKTLVVDVIDDIVVMLEQAICWENKVKSLGDIGYGKGYALFNAALQQMVMDLKALPMNIIYISREIAITDENTGATTYHPSLKTKYYNIVNGNCDIEIRTKKVGDGTNATYFREVKGLRTQYDPKNITDKRVLQLLQTCNGIFKKENK
ncbi:AAA family ATPase [Lactobacillus sp. ESL0230]|uniref:AAA family ATPase n=1 Tax=Lactobacillus sp. ESL0230 TaxID=2069353 RepID=UPI000EFACC4E|nr:AAA family ATPase [Lactobacillus sp. ESL0230]RMC46539.1 NTP-binding protein [Lactobacillus sp. ESL0230]